MNLNISIIILNWNGWKDTIECLESLYQIDYSNYNVIVVDNGSSDESVDKIKEYCQGKIKVKSNYFEYDQRNKPIKLFEYTEEEFKDDVEKLIDDLPSNRTIILIKNRENYGFADGNNIGINYAINNLKSDYILLLNNDTVVDPEFLNELINVAESSPEIGAVGPKTYFYDNENMIQWAAGGFMEPEYFKVESIGSFEIDNGQYDENRELDYIVASCILCKREVIEKAGLLDHSYFMYFEDIDWSIKILRSGYKCYYAYKSKIWHKMGVSSTNCFKTHYYHMNRIYLVKKNFKSTKYLKSLIRFIFTIFPKESLDMLRSKGFKHFLCYLHGILGGITKRVK